MPATTGARTGGSAAPHEIADLGAARDEVVRSYAAVEREASLAEVARRVARGIADAEPAAERARWRERFEELMASAVFLPSVPVLANAGRGGQLAACFVLETDDSLDSIYATLSRAARIQQGSGGTGIDLSALRPSGSRIERTGGTTPGPVGFLELFASSARVNRCSGRRPGAHAAILRANHPDVRAFVSAKRAAGETLTGVSLVLAVSDALIDAVRSDGWLELEDGQGTPRGQLRARPLMQEICASIAETGEPTLLFGDTIERANPTPQLGRIGASNPCGEQPLLDGESCVLGSLHLPAFADEHGRVDRDRLAQATRDAVRLLDDLVEINVYPDAHIEQATRRTRKIGLGVMGVADLLLLQGLPYADARARSGMDELLAWVRLHAERASEELAQQRGVFPAHTRGFPARRNASLLAIAPTGILRLIAGCSGGMEPFLRPAQEVTGPRGTRRWVDRWLARWSRQHCADPEALWQALHEERDTADLPGVPDPLRPLLRRAWEIPPEAQLEMQARLQSHVDGAVSKTVHLASDATAAAIEPLIFRAHDSGCKGVSFYRRGASAAQAVALPFTGAPELDS